MYEIGDKFEIEIDRDFIDENDNRLYLIKGFNSLVFDKNGLDMLKRAKKKYDDDDLVKAQEEAFDRGYDAGYKDGYETCKTEHKNNAEESIKTVKASELAVDTKVICWSKDERYKSLKNFALLFNGYLYAYPDKCTSKSDYTLVMWEHMTLEDGTVVLPE